VKTKHAIFNVLTAEQQVKWLKTIEYHKGHGKKMRG
jgi:Spy/CpxP family protein refolding chaperone